MLTSLSTKLLILGVSVNTAVGQLLLKRGVSGLARPVELAGLYKFVWSAARSPWVYAALTAQGLSYLLWMMVVSQVKLGVATASAGAFFYILMSLSAWFFFGESLSSWQWAGILLITIGVTLVSLGPA